MSNPMKVHIAGIVLVAMLAMASSSLDNSIWYSFMKPIATISIILLPIIHLPNWISKSTWLIGALIFCLVGDLLLLWSWGFIFGLVAFLVAHIFFVVQIRKLAKIPLIGWPLLVFLVIGIIFLFFIGPSLNDLLGPVILYMLIMVLLNAQATQYYWQARNSNSLLISTGAFLFLVSDAVLAWNRFYQPISGANWIILSTYWSAISLLTIGCMEIIRHKLYE